MAGLKYWVWLATRPGVGNQARLALLDAFGSPENVYCADRDALLQTPGITRAMLEGLEDKSLEGADRVLGDCDRLGLGLLTIQDALYPDRLRNIYDPPVLLYVQGRMPLFDEEAAVAMVGTRRCTPYGAAVAQRLAYELASQGALVISGLAAGIDACAHRGALRAGGLTAAVIGGGHDIRYPSENRYLYQDIAAAGVILSEYPPGTEHRGRHFPVRNRILSGLAAAALVVEAPERSGALITAALALEQGRDVFAVPGPVGARESMGCHRLIQEGAGLVTEGRDLLRCLAPQFPGRLRLRYVDLPEDLRPAGGERPLWTPQPPEPQADPAPAAEPARPAVDYRDPALGLTDDQIKIMECLGSRTLHMDDIIEETQIPARRASSALSMLQVDGHVAKEGMRYRAAGAQS